MDAPGAAGLTDADLAERLRRSGLRVTRPRVIVYRRLRALGGHRSADEVTADLRRAGERVSRMSVYNSLAALQEAGLLMRADAGPGRVLYEAGGAWHHHFVCRACRKVLDVPCARGRKPCLRPPSRIGRAEEAQVIFRGLCRECARAAKPGRSRRYATPRSRSVDAPGGLR